MARVLSRVNVGVQIGLVGAIGVFGLIAVGLAYYVGSSRIADANLALKNSTTTFETLSEINVDLLEARRGEKNFLLRRDDASGRS